MTSPSSQSWIILAETATIIALRISGSYARCVIPSSLKRVAEEIGAGLKSLKVDLLMFPKTELVTMFCLLSRQHLCSAAK
jgi:hypothetical protein